MKRSGLLPSALFAVLCLPILAEEGATKVERVTESGKLEGGSLSTVGYEPSEAEVPFSKKAGEGEATTGSMFEEYSITGKTGKYVGWFGIVRKIAEDAAKKTTTLTVEMKYFDGLTDSHIMALSFHGAGDFVAELKGTALGITSLSLVKVYGTVAGEDKDVPRVGAEFVRNWEWGAFTFLMVYGAQKGNGEWLKLCQVSDDQIYETQPDEDYYVKRLGPRGK